MKIALLIFLMFLNVSCKKEIPEIAPSPATVQVITIKKTPLNIRKASTGFVEAIEKVDIRARISGFLEKKFFKDGQKVKINDKLFLIEPDDYIASVNLAKANMDMAIAEERKDKLQYDRAEKLIKTNTISKSAYDEQVSAYGVSLAKVGQARASLRQAELSLGYTSVTSPINGTISDNNFDVGNYVSLESTPLTTVVNTDLVKVNFSISEKFLFKIINNIKSAENITKYMRAVLILPNGKEYEYKGDITFVNNAIDLSTNTLRLKAIFKNPDGLLKDGQYAKIEIETIDPIPSIVIPQTLILVDQQGRYVFTVDKNSKAVVKRIETSGNYGTNVLVVNGLDEGDRIIVAGYQSLKPMMEVNAKDFVPKSENQKTDTKNDVPENIIPDKKTDEKEAK